MRWVYSYSEKRNVLKRQRKKKYYGRGHVNVLAMSFTSTRRQQMPEHHMWSANAAALSVDGWQPTEDAVVMQPQRLVPSVLTDTKAHIINCLLHATKLSACCTPATVMDLSVTQMNLDPSHNSCDRLSIDTFSLYFVKWCQHITEVGLQQAASLVSILRTLSNY